ncbi:hypothetical protein COI_2052 [Mannheimia haemolytica serotype A2 str. OVINE]|nr:hypothetical protein COI_2052 [Mannheimia haemolytica serotype A2 str. OVINE]
MEIPKIGRSRAQNLQTIKRSYSLTVLYSSHSRPLVKNCCFLTACNGLSNGLA